MFFVKIIWRLFVSARTKRLQRQFTCTKRHLTREFDTLFCYTIVEIHRKTS